MFGSLTDKFQSLFSALSRQKHFTEDNLAEATRHVRLALLEADVNYAVAGQFIKRVKEKSVGVEILKSVSPKDQFIKIIHDELVSLMGDEESSVALNHTPSLWLLCGLQGNGKTTQAAKLAYLYSQKPHHKKVLLVACDLQRPAAVLQLKTLAEQAKVGFFYQEGVTSPVKMAEAAKAFAIEQGYNLVIFDTAGRLAIDEALMKELQSIKMAVNPHEVLFVASSAIGQDAVATAKEFDAKIGITGSILTMLDGSARAGSALSIREVTGKPLKFEGVGEKLGDIQLFHPKSMADRILGMGDIISLVRKAEMHAEEHDKEEMERKLRKAEFTYADFLKQMGFIRKMGSLKSIMQMLPGMSGMGDLDFSEKEFTRMEAIILSMTPAEREGRVEIEFSRRRRISKGSGTSIDDVNRLVKNFKRLKQLVKSLPSMKKMLSKEGSFKEFLSGKF